MTTAPLCEPPCSTHGRCLTPWLLARWQLRFEILHCAHERFGQLDTVLQETTPRESLRSLREIDGVERVEIQRAELLLLHDRITILEIALALRIWRPLRQSLPVRRAGLRELH